MFGHLVGCLVDSVWYGCLGRFVGSPVKSCVVDVVCPGHSGQRRRPRVGFDAGPLVLVGSGNLCPDIDGFLEVGVEAGFRWKKSANRCSSSHNTYCANHFLKNVSAFSIGRLTRLDSGLLNTVVVFLAGKTA